MFRKDKSVPFKGIEFRVQVTILWLIYLIYAQIDINANIFYGDSLHVYAKFMLWHYDLILEGNLFPYVNIKLYG